MWKHDMPVPDRPWKQSMLKERDGQRAAMGFVAKHANMQTNHSHVQGLGCRLRCQINQCLDVAETLVVGPEA
jgi:hypothetical protein